LDELLSDKIDNSVFEANKENLQYLSQTLNSIINDPKSSSLNPLTLQQAVTKTIISIAKKTHEMVETEQKLLNEEKIAELNKSLSNHEHICNNMMLSQNSISNHKTMSAETSSSKNVETSEDMISVFPLFSIFVLFLYKLMQISNNVCKKAVGKSAVVDQSTKTGDEEKKLDER
jgi:hypothetical protein